MHQRPFEVGAMKGESTMIRLNTMLTKRGFIRPYASNSDYWTNLTGVSVYRKATTITFVHTDRKPSVVVFDRKDKEGVMRHIASLEVKL